MKRFAAVIFLCLTLCVPDLYAEREIDPLFGDTIDRTADDFVIASLCVAEPTNWRDDALGVYGHAFVRLQCPVFGMDYCFSYESERINGQLIRYWTGKLKMGMFNIPTDEYLQAYRQWNRAVHEYALNLPPDVEQRLWQIMDKHVMEGSELILDLKKRGCSSSVEQYIEEALRPIKISYAKKYEASDFRVPARLVQIWSEATIEGHPLLTYKGDLVEAPSVTWWNIWFDPAAFAVILSVIVIIALIVIFRRKHRKPA